MISLISLWRQNHIEHNASRVPGEMILLIYPTQHTGTAQESAHIGGFGFQARPDLGWKRLERRDCDLDLILAPDDLPGTFGMAVHQQRGVQNAAARVNPLCIGWRND